MATGALTGRLWRMSIDWPFAEVHDEEDADYFAWTAPEALRCGDRIALYEGGRGNHSAFIAVGRAVTDAVRAHRGDRRHWAWIQWVPLEHARSLNDVRHDVGYGHVSGSHVRVDENRFQLWAYLIRDHAAKRSAESWRRGEQFPTTDQVPMSYLFDAKWRYRPKHEVAMYESIMRTLIAGACVEVPDELSMLLRSMRGPTPTRAELVVGRRPDLFVLEGHRHRTLVIIEVKRRARHLEKSDFDPVDQVRNYVDAAYSTLSQTPFSGLTIRAMIVAHEIDGAERDHAHAVGVECRLLMKRTHELRSI
jgi:hypothetical protein